MLLHKSDYAKTIMEGVFIGKGLPVSNPLQLERPSSLHNGFGHTI